MKGFEIVGLGLIIFVLAVMTLGGMSNPQAFAKLGVYGAMEQESGLGDSGRKSIRGASWRMKKVIIPVMHCN